VITRQSAERGWPVRGYQPYLEARGNSSRQCVIWAPYKAQMTAAGSHSKSGSKALPPWQPRYPHRPQPRPPRTVKNSPPEFHFLPGLTTYLETVCAM
jgi:hypothetical protein